MKKRHSTKLKTIVVKSVIRKIETASETFRMVLVLSRNWIRFLFVLFATLIVTSANVYSPQSSMNIARIVFRGMHQDSSFVTLTPGQSQTFNAPPPPSGWALFRVEFDLLGITGISQADFLASNGLKVNGAIVSSFKLDSSFNYAYYTTTPGSSSITVTNNSPTNTISFTTSVMSFYHDVADMFTAQVDDSHLPLRKIYVNVPIGFINQYETPSGPFNWSIDFQLAWEGRAVIQHLYNPGPAGEDLLPYRSQQNALGRFMEFGGTYAKITLARPSQADGFKELGKPVEGCCWELDLNVVNIEQPSGPEDTPIGWVAPTASNALEAFIANQVDMRQTITLTHGQSITITPPAIEGWYRNYDDYFAIESETNGVQATDLVPSAGINLGGCNADGPYGPRSCWDMYGDAVTVTNTGSAATFKIEYRVVYYSPLKLEDKTSQQGSFLQHDVSFKLPKYKDFAKIGFDNPSTYSLAIITVPLTNPQWQSSNFTTPSGRNANDQTLNAPADIELGYLEGETLQGYYTSFFVAVAYMYQVLGDGAAGEWTITLLEPTS